MKHYMIIYGGSGYKQGKTWDIVLQAKHYLNAALIDVSDYTISFFDYNHHNQEDDFKIIAEQMLQTHTIIFATPVYWYAMSAQLKVFFDRLSDLITVRKPWGRQLKDKTMTFIATGHSDMLPDGFDVPFRRTADYFQMQFKDPLYICTNTHLCMQEICQEKLQKFLKTISTD